MTYPDYLGEPARLPGRSEPARPQRIRDWPHAEWLAVAAVGFGAITSSLDSGVVTVAYPKFVHELHRPLSQIAWLVLVSQLTVVATLVLFGKRADSVGRKRVYLDGFVIFVLGALACAFAPNFGCLLGARAFEALGVAMVQANSVALVASSVRDQHRTTALGIQASAQAIGLAIGPFLGGLLVGYVSWRMIFLLSTPLAVVAFGASILFLPRSRSTVPAQRLNIAGAVVLALAAGGLVGGLTMAAKQGWRGPTLGFVAVGLAAAIALVPVERHSPSPLFEPRLLIRRVVRRSLLSVLATWITFFGLITTVPFFVERDLAGSTSVGGATTVAVPVGLIIMAPFIGRLRRRFQRRSIARVATGAVVFAIAGILLHPNLWEAVAALVVVGVGIGASNTLNSTAVMNDVDDADRGVASGLINLARAGGSALGVAIASTALDVVDTHSARAAIGAMVLTAAGGALIALWPQRSAQ